VLAGVLLGSAGAIGAALGQTAKAHLPRALEAARKWQPDAALHGITSSSVSLKGTATGAMWPLDVWMYFFYSSKTKKAFRVLAAAQKLESGEWPGAVSASPVTADFIDSDRAMSILTSNGFKPAGPINIFFGNFCATAPINRCGPLWYATDLSTDGKTLFFVDAKTGQFLGKKDR